MLKSMVLDTTNELAGYGLLGSANSILLWVIMALIGVFALYFSARWIVGQQSMLLAIIVVVVAFIVGYALNLIPVVGWILTILFILAYVIIIKLVYCRGPKHGWTEAVIIWVVTIILAFVLGLLFAFGLVLLLSFLDYSASVSPIVTYTVLILIMALVLYILYWAVTKIMTKPRSTRQDYD